MDLGDKTSHYYVLDSEGEMVRESTVATTKKGMKQRFGHLPKCRIAIEVGTHSPWVSRLLSSFGHEVIVANARQVKLISASSRKDDRLARPRRSDRPSPQIVPSSPSSRWKERSRHHSGSKD